MIDLTTLLRAERARPTVVSLPTKGPVEVAKLRRTETRWAGLTPPKALVPNKPWLEFEGEALWAEIIILRLLERDDWQGAWANNWRGAFWRDPWGSVADLGPDNAALIRTIAAGMGARRGQTGCWDVFAWRGSDVLFIEAKMRGRDRIRPSQAAWLESALGLGVPLSSFAIVEWSIG